MTKFEFQAGDKLMNPSPCRISSKKLSMTAISDKKCGIETNRRESAVKENKFQLYWSEYLNTCISLQRIIYFLEL